MPAVHETAYPRLKEAVTPADLAEVYTPTAEGTSPSPSSTSPRPGARLGFLVLLKTFQRLGYFVLVGEVPPPIVQHVARCLGLDPCPEDLLRYDESGTRRRHIPIIRAFLNVQPFNSAARTLIAAVVREAAQTKEDLADLINVAIEELIRNRYRAARIHDPAQGSAAGPGGGQSRPLPARRLGPGRRGTRQLDRILTAGRHDGTQLVGRHPRRCRATDADAPQAPRRPPPLAEGTQCRGHGLRSHRSCQGRALRRRGEEPGRRTHAGDPAAEALYARRGPHPGAGGSHPRRSGRDPHQTHDQDPPQGRRSPRGLPEASAGPNR